MEPRTARFDEALRSGAVVVAKVDVQRTGPTGLVTTLAENLPVEPGGTVTVDATAAQRRAVSLTVVTGTLTPKVAADPLSPYGSELVVSVGFRYIDGGTELLPVGVFRITGALNKDRGRVVLEGVDRSIVVQEARFETPYVVPPGQRLVGPGQSEGAIRDLVNSRYPGLTYVQDSSVVTTVPTSPTTFEEGDRSGDPWKNAADLAAAAGLEVFFDVRGRVVVRKVPSPTGPSAFDYSPGEASVKISAANKLSTEAVRNVAVVAGEGTGVATPVRATAEITDTNNPLHPGIIGRRPVFLVSPLITTLGQAQAAADALLQRQAGGSELLTFTAVGHPAHEGGDVVTVGDPRLAGGTAVVVLRSWTLPLTLRAPVTYSTFARRTT